MAQNKGRCPECQSAAAQFHGIIEEPTDSGKPLAVGKLWTCTRCAIAYVVTASEVYRLGDRVKRQTVPAVTQTDDPRPREVKATHTDSDMPWSRGG